MSNSTASQFFEAIMPERRQVSPLPEDIVSETYHTIHGYRLKCIKRIVKAKRQHKTEERWYCLKECLGADLPAYVREGAHRTGFKSFRSFFALMGYFRMR